MKNVVCFLTLFLITSLYAQKERYYFDDNFNPIGMKDFFNKENLNYEFLKLEIEIDTAIIYKIEKRELKGKLNKENHLLILNYIKKIINKEVDSSKTILINYYPGKDKCNSTGGKSYVLNLHQEYVKKLKSYKNVNQYFIYKSKDGLQELEKYFNWYPDTENVIEKSFFPLPYPCGSYLIIYPDGKYFSYKGEYYLPSIFKYITLV